MSIDKTIQFKSSFIWENYIENKIRVIISFSHHDVAEFHTTIKIIFAQLLYQMNLIRVELDFLQNSLHRHATNIMLLICFANTKVDIFDKWLCNIQLFFFTNRRYWSSWTLAILYASSFIETPDRSLHGGSRNGCIFIAKSFVKNLPNFIVRSFTITPSSHHEKRYSLSFWKISHRRWKIIKRILNLWGKIFQTIRKIFLIN